MKLWENAFLLLKLVESQTPHVLGMTAVMEMENYVVMNVYLSSMVIMKSLIAMENVFLSLLSVMFNVLLVHLSVAEILRQNAYLRKTFMSTDIVQTMTNALQILIHVLNVKKGTLIVEGFVEKKQNSGSAMEPALSSTNNVTIAVPQKEKLVVMSFVFQLRKVFHILQEIIKYVMENAPRHLSHAIIHVLLKTTSAIFHKMRLRVMDAMTVMK